VDQLVGQRLQFFAHFANTPSQATSFNAYQTGSDEEISDQNARSFTLGSTWRITSSAVTEFRFNWTNNIGRSSSVPAAIGGAVPYPISLLVPPQYSAPGAVVQASGAILMSSPSFSETFIPPYYLENHVAVRQYNFVDSLAWTRGGHSFKFGVDLRRLQSFYSDVNYAASILALSVASVQQGIADDMAIDAARPGHPTFTNLSLFAQDSWKANHRLSVDYGIRWEFNPAPRASDGVYPLALTTANLETAQLAPTGTPQYRDRYLNFAPRLGFAYNVNSDQNHPLILRGGFGLFYDTGQSLGAGGYQGYPFSAETDLSNVSLPAPASETAPPSLSFPLVPPYGNLVLNDPKLLLPYTEQWNLSLSAGLSARNSLTVSYVGNTGRRLLYSQLFTNLSAVNPDFTFLTLTSNAASSRYNALQVQDQGYVTSGLRLIASYTWAHAIDNASTDNPSAPPTPGNSDNDIRQVLNAALNYEIPSASSNRLLRALSSGWSLDTRFTAQTGVPVDVYESFYYIEPGQHAALAFPDLVKGVPLVLRNVPGDPFGWALNPAAFGPVPLNPDGSPTREGTLPRNYVHGPGFWNLTSAAQRRFLISERFRLIFRVEAFNLLNHANGGTPDPCLCDGSAFGIIGGGSHTFGVPNPLYATGSARSLQLALKLQF
jgi:hypothetical protein